MSSKKSRCPLSLGQKRIMLQHIRENVQYFFLEFNPRLSLSTRQMAWKQLLTRLKSHGFVLGIGKDWRYLKYTWALWRSSALHKRATRKPLSTIYKLVLEICDLLSAKQTPVLIPAEMPPPVSITPVAEAIKQYTSLNCRKNFADEEIPTAFEKTIDSLNEHLPASSSGRETVGSCIADTNPNFADNSGVTTLNSEDAVVNSCKRSRDLVSLITNKESNDASRSFAGRMQRCSDAAKQSRSSSSLDSKIVRITSVSHSAELGVRTRVLCNNALCDFKDKIHLRCVLCPGTYFGVKFQRWDNDLSRSLEHFWKHFEEFHPNESSGYECCTCGRRDFSNRNEFVQHTFALPPVGFCCTRCGQASNHRGVIFINHKCSICQDDSSRPPHGSANQTAEKSNINPKFFDSRPQQSDASETTGVTKLVAETSEKGNRRRVSSTSTKVYRCSLCSKSYTTFINFRNHHNKNHAVAKNTMWELMQKWKSKQVYECVACNARYATHQGAKNHAAKFHPNMDIQGVFSVNRFGGDSSMQTVGSKMPKGGLSEFMPKSWLVFRDNPAITTIEPTEISDNSIGRSSLAINCSIGADNITPAPRASLMGDAIPELEIKPELGVKLKLDRAELSENFSGSRTTEVLAVEIKTEAKQEINSNLGCDKSLGDEYADINSANSCGIDAAQADIKLECLQNDLPLHNVAQLNGNDVLPVKMNIRSHNLSQILVKPEPIDDEFVY